MRSKRAEKYINKADGDSKIVYRFEAVTAVELAEDDARERAVKSYCKSVYGVFCDDCDSCDFDTDTCERRNEYLKYYDNEE